MADSKLASVMIKLLRDEVESVRAKVEEARQHRDGQAAQTERLASVIRPEELGALQAENARLQAEVEAARAKVSQLERTHGRSMSNTIDAHFKTIDGVRRRMSDTKKKHAEELERVEVLRAELRDRQAQHGFDPLYFLQDKLPNSDSEDIADLSITIPSPAQVFVLPEVAADHCVPGGYMEKHHDEIVWSNTSSTKSHFISLATTHRYNPRANDPAGRWETAWDMVNHDGSKDFFYMEDKNWHYLGTYECAGQAILPLREIKGRLRPHVHRLRKKAFLFPETLPPALTDIAEGMLDGGVLQVACTGWRRVGFNDRLAQTLRSEATFNSVRSRPSAKGVPVQVPKEGSRTVPGTIAEDEHSSTEERPRKKQKKADQKTQKKASQKAQRRAKRAAQRTAKRKAQRKAKQKAQQKAKQKTH
ncbi:hypothetical protein GY45DRAFT_1366948 [Cubamyces sp. BRFM 1775]|nr:hypothetical protein GY45DRAFT_1366948 [Cubamyces sp. BRFM 1775]